MVKANEILEGIRRQLLEQWPERPVYDGNLPESITEPAFGLTEESVQMLDAGPDCVEISASYGILGLLPLENGRSDRLALGGLRWDLLGLFAEGLVPVGGRALNITKCTSSILEGRVSVELGLTFYDDRREAEASQTMEQVQIRTETE
ncbi:MAG: hypothetical protein HFJ84_10150 [Clostridiales bacterium]|nr:hypothetical protein [Clostridiales bacterium]